MFHGLGALFQDPFAKHNMPEYVRLVFILILKTRKWHCI